MSIIDFNSKKKRAENVLGNEESLVSRTESDSGFSLKGTFDESKMKRYQMAIEKKAILFDKEDSDGVDYTHLDFILSTGCGFYKGMTNLAAVQLFWKSFYPYLKSITDNYEKFYDQFRNIIDDQEQVLKDHATLDFKYKWAMEFMKGIKVDKKFEYFLEMKMQDAVKNAVHVKRAADNLPDLKEE